MKTRTGRASIYICYEPNFNGPLRPCHDSSPLSANVMTEAQVRTLRDRITRYMRSCEEKNSAKGLLKFTANTVM